MEVSKLPYYLQRPFYQPKEAEPTQVANDASAQTGESAESPAPNVDQKPPSQAPPPPVVKKPTPEAAVYTFNWLSATGTALLLTGIVSGLVLGFSLLSVSICHTL